MLSLFDPVFNTNTKKLNKDWQQLKLLITLAIDANNHNEAFKLLRALGYIGYRYNFLPNFVDDEADELIAKLTQSIIPHVPQVAVKKERVVFYDYFLLENRGFTQQYLDQIIKNDFDILFITLADERDFSSDNAIIKTLNSYDKAQIYVVPYQETKARQVALMADKILEYAPSKVFNHNIPYDLLPVCVALALKGSGIKTYFLNISDHAFFLGKNAFDYFIDFRIYGHQLNALLRKIDQSQLLIIPTPPYLTPDKYTKFEDFPVDVTGKVVGFSGGMTYKIIDEDNTFLNLIKQLLQENPDFIFLFANVFGDELLQKFIKNNKLENRLILIGNRRDINEVYKRIDIYVNTYPFSGSLMMQYAIAHNKPVLSLSDEELVYVRMDKLFDKPWNDKFIITDQKKFIEIGNNLIRDARYRKSYATELKAGIDTTEQFEDKFAQLLNDTYEQIPVDMNSFDINVDAVAAFHINMDNIFFKEYLFLKKAFLPQDNIVKKVINYTIPHYLLRAISRLNKQKYGPTILRY